MAKAKKSVAAAPAKRSRKSKTTAPQSSANLPKGFQRVVGGFSQRWDHIAQPVLIGTWGEVREVTVPRGRKQETARCVDVEQDNGVSVTVWESAGLKAAFETIEPGQTVYIEYLGLGEVRKKGQNPPKLFTVAYK